MHKLWEMCCWSLLWYHSISTGLTWLNLLNSGENQVKGVVSIFALLFVLCCQTAGGGGEHKNCHKEISTFCKRSRLFVYPLCSDHLMQQHLMWAKRGFVFSVLVSFENSIGLVVHSLQEQSGLAELIKVSRFVFSKCSIVAWNWHFTWTCIKQTPVKTRQYRVGRSKCDWVTTWMLVCKFHTCAAPDGTSMTCARLVVLFCLAKYSHCLVDFGGCRKKLTCCRRTKGHGSSRKENCWVMLANVNGFCCNCTFVRVSQEETISCVSLR